MNVANPAGKERGSPLSAKGGRSRLECFNLIKAKTVHLLLGEKTEQNKLGRLLKALGGASCKHESQAGRTFPLYQ